MVPSESALLTKQLSQKRVSNVGNDFVKVIFKITVVFCWCIHWMFSPDQQAPHVTFRKKSIKVGSFPKVTFRGKMQSQHKDVCYKIEISHVHVRLCQFQVKGLISI